MSHLLLQLQRGHCGPVPSPHVQDTALLPHLSHVPKVTGMLPLDELVVLSRTVLGNWLLEKHDDSAAEQMLTVVQLQNGSATQSSFCTSGLCKATVRPLSTVMLILRRAVHQPVVARGSELVCSCQIQQ